MPSLVCEAGDLRLVLGSRCIVGRGPHVQLRIGQGIVSSEHASVYYDGVVWNVRDLGSRNGTFLDGQRLASGLDCPLDAGARLSFGGPDEPCWVLDGVHPPVPAARNSAGVLHLGQASTLWLPSPEDPEACVRFQAGRWRIESSGEARFARDTDRFRLGEEVYVLELPPEPMEQAALDDRTVDVASQADLELRFSVSRDQEHVNLEARSGGVVFPLGARAHNYGLLVLARRRLAEREEGTVESECGWIYAQDLRGALALDREVLNLQLWRATQAFKKAGLPAEQLIERRLDSQQLRIGFSRLDVGDVLSVP